MGCGHYLGTILLPTEINNELEVAANIGDQLVQGLYSNTSGHCESKVNDPINLA